MSRTIEVENVGPISYLSIPVPDDGGFVVLRGTHGTGKTTTLNAVGSLVSRNGTIEKRDGAIEGHISGFGATISVKKQVRRTGELELAVDALSGRLSLADIVDPHIKDAAAADAYRIKALLAIAGAKPKLEDFYVIVGGKEEFDAIHGPGVADARDVVELAAKVKRKINEVALAEERLSQKASGEAAALKRESEECDVLEILDEAQLQGDLEDAIGREATVKAQVKAANEAKANAQKAQQSLEESRRSYTGATVEDAAKSVAEESENVCEAEADVDRLQAALDKAKANLKAAEARSDRATTTLNVARSHFDQLARWQKSIDASAKVTCPTEAELAGAAEAVSLARQQIEKQALARRARDSKDKAVQAGLKAELHEVRAKELRAAADKTDDVLTSMVSSLNSPLVVKYGRLILETDRGEELFADLSDGERYKVAFGVVIPLLPEDGLLTLSQAAWGELSPATRRELNEELKRRRAVCLTASVTDDEELHAEAFAG